MRLSVILLAFVLTLLVGCGDKSKNTSIVNSPDDSPGSHSAIAEDHIELHVQGVDLYLPRPYDWEFYETEYGIVMAEEIGSVATDGRLGGLLTHIFIHPLEEFEDIPITASANEAHQLLDAIIHNSDYVGHARTSTPIAFDWNGLDAAYYLMTNKEGNVTIVLGVVAPGTHKLVATSVSAPPDHSGRLRTSLPELLGGMVINDVVLDRAALDVLPDPLAFPARY